MSNKYDESLTQNEEKHLTYSHKKQITACFIRTFKNIVNFISILFLTATNAPCASARQALRRSRPQTGQNLIQSAAFSRPAPRGTRVSTLPSCPKCNSEYTYEDGAMLVCPECAHEWSATASSEAAADDNKVIKDSVGNVLQDGDTITVIKDLKVKGSSLVVKVGTKVKGIRLCDGDHDIDCKIDGIGAMKLKSEFVRKV